MSTSIIEVKKSALEKNLNFLRSYVNKSVKISPVIKGNAYGHGVEIIVPAFESLGIDHFSVFSSTEAKRAFNVKNSGTTLMIMGYVLPLDYEWVIRNEIEFFIFEIKTLHEAIRIARETEKKAIIHLDLETGMNRTGLSREEMVEAATLIKKNPEYIKVKGVSTHYAGAESIANHVRIMHQYKLFQKRIRQLEKLEIEPEIRHSACSAATINYPRTWMDMIRVGILLYGFWPTRETFIQYISKKQNKTNPLERAIAWKTRVMSVNTVKEGQFVGYGFGYQAQSDMQVAIIPVGYANGYSRMLSNNGHVLINETRADVIGLVNMNMALVNVSETEQVKIGDEVILIGNQGDYEITVNSFVEMNNSMNYELLTRLSERITRKIV